MRDKGEHLVIVKESIYQKIILNICALINRAVK